MKQSVTKRLLSVAVATMAAMQCICASVTVSAADTMPVYKKVDNFKTHQTNGSGTQGTDGWYYMYKNGETGEYTEMNWNGGRFAGPGGSDINEHFVNPGYGTPAVLAWEAQYTGTVTLSLTDATLYRNGPNTGHGDVVATLKLNNETIKQNDGTNAKWTFDETCKNGSGNKNYTIKNIHVEKGDVIYHEVDCGTDNYNAGLYWKPIITYNEIEALPPRILNDGNSATGYIKKTDAYSHGQGYYGYYYLAKPSGSTEYKKLNVDGGNYSYNGSYITEHFVQPAANNPLSIAWKAPYSGVVLLRTQDNIIYREMSNGDGCDDITLTIRKNDEIIKKNNGEDARWVFDKNSGNRAYTTYYVIEQVHVNKGDIIYHEVDCGTNGKNTMMYWKPIVAYTYFDEQGTEANPYVINNVTDYKNFADKVNSTEPSAVAKITADFDWNSNTPQLNNFSGKIDGNGHTINLRGKSLVASAKDGAVINNLILSGNVSEDNNAAAFIASTDSENNDTVTIENCINLAKVKAKNDNAAGFVANVSDNDTVIVRNSFNYGDVTSMGTTMAPMVNDNPYANVSLENCFYKADSENEEDSMAKTAEQFASGEVAYLMNMGARNLVLGQIVGVDAYPTHSTDITKVVYKNNNAYSNSGAFAVKNGNSAVVCASRKAWVVTAQYNGDVLVSVNVKNVNANTKYTLSTALSNTATKCKVFVWDDVSSLKPLCEAAE